MGAPLSVIDLSLTQGRKDICCFRQLVGEKVPGFSSSEDKAKVTQRVKILKPNKRTKRNQGLPGIAPYADD